MSIYVMSQVWAGSQHKGAALLLMLALADFAHDDGTNAFPSVATLANKTRMSDRQVQRLIRQCERSGELVAERSTDGLHSTRYTVVLNALNVTGGKMSPAYRRLGPGDNGVTRNVLKETSEASNTEEKAQDTWADILEQLTPMMSRSNYETYLEGTIGLQIHYGVLAVQASPMQAEALKGRFAPLLRRVLGEWAVRFVPR